MVLATLDDGIRIVHVQTSEQVVRWRDSFARAYPTVFEGPPYFEQFSSDDAVAIWDRFTQMPETITLLAVSPENAVVGFGIAIPLRVQKDVATQLSGLIPVNHTFYLAELGVLPTHRGRKLGRTLVWWRMHLMDLERYEGVVLRVAEGRNASMMMYQAMGFEDMGVYMDVNSTRTDGTIRSDRRLLLHCVLSQVDIDKHDDEGG